MERNRNIISLFGVGQNAYGTMSLYLNRVATKLIKWISSCKYLQWISRNPEYKFLMTFSTQRQSSRNFQSSATSIGSDALLERAFRWTWGCLLYHLKFITRYKILYFIVVDRLQWNSWTFRVTYYCRGIGRWKAQGRVLVIITEVPFRTSAQFHIFLLIIIRVALSNAAGRWIYVNISAISRKIIH